MLAQRLRGLPTRLVRAFALPSLLMLAACKGDPTGVLPSSVGASGPQATAGGSMPSAGGATVNVAIQDFSFAPAMITVKVGTTVKWTNNGPSSHTVTSDAGRWGSATLAPPNTMGMGMGMGTGMGMGYGTDDMGGAGASFQFTFTEPGTYGYHCTMHPPATYPAFVGVVTVVP
jgi:plastocyanin